MNVDKNEPRPPFRISSSAEVDQHVKQLAEFAGALGKKKAFLGALREIVTRLKSAPFEFGECRYRLAHGKMRCHIGAIQPAAVQFAIHEESANVILLNVFLLGS